MSEVDCIVHYYAPLGLFKYRYGYGRKKMTNEQLQNRLKAWGIPCANAILVFHGHHGDSYFSLSDMEKIKKAGEMLNEQIVCYLPDDMTEKIKKEKSELASLSETLNMLATKHGNEAMIKKGQMEVDRLKKHLEHLEKEQREYNMYKVVEEQGGEYITIFLLDYGYATLEYFSNVKENENETF